MTTDTCTKASVTPDLEQLVVPEALIRQFDRTGPRYTSYPTADRFQKDYPASQYRQHLQQRAAQETAPPLSIYAHLPFCESLCYFCACNKIITQDHSKSGDYLDYLFKEMAMVQPLLGRHNRAVQLHLGGGTPTFLSHDEMALLVEHVHRHFAFSDDAELGIEIDPRTVDTQRIEQLATLGFNRTSFGVQDFNPEVQAAVNRIQPYELVKTCLEAARSNGFKSINTDLIYGLPKQTLASFTQTLDQLIELSPDRIALYNYAHLPDLFKAQRLIYAKDLPSAEERVQIFITSVQRLLDAGYVYLGLDHFAKPSDELNKARLDHSLHRNFQGYTTHAQCDMVSFGISAIGKIGSAYIQNAHSLKAYKQLLDKNQLPTAKGYNLSLDDVLRREVIMTLMCGMTVNFADISQRYAISFQAYFQPELAQMTQFIEAELVVLDDKQLSVTAKGRFFVRGLAMLFDAYLGKQQTATYSKLV